jgi:hypothetical protein
MAGSPAVPYCWSPDRDEDPVTVGFIDERLGWGLGVGADAEVTVFSRNLRTDSRCSSGTLG